MMVIKLIRNEGCHIWQNAEKVLKEALRDASLPEEYEIVEVKNDEEVKKYHFYGSPQIIINDKDIDPTSQKATQFQAEGCRIYVWPPAQRASGSARKMYEYPPREMILEAIKKVGGEDYAGSHGGR